MATSVISSEYDVDSCLLRLETGGDGSVLIMTIQTSFNLQILVNIQIFRKLYRLFSDSFSIPTTESRNPFSVYLL